MEALIVPFVIVPIVVFLIVLITGEIVTDKKRKAAWQEVADRLRLHYQNDQIHGTLRDIVVRVWIEVRGTGKEQRSWTLFQASLAGEVPHGLKLSREGLLVKLGKVIGTLEDIQLDLPGVDQQIQVRADDPAEVRRWAQRADVSRALVDLVEQRVDFYVFPHQMKLEVVGVPSEIEAIEGQIEKLVDIARALSGKGYGALIDDGQW